MRLTGLNSSHTSNTFPEESVNGRHYRSLTSVLAFKGNGQVP